jgi:hypothetical protein
VDQQKMRCLLTIRKFVVLILVNNVSCLHIYMPYMVLVVQTKTMKIDVQWIKWIHSTSLRTMTNWLSQSAWNVTDFSFTVSTSSKLNLRKHKQTKVMDRQNMLDNHLKAFAMWSVFIEKSANSWEIAWHNTV